MAIYVNVQNHVTTQTIIFDNDNSAKAFMFDMILEENAKCFLEDCVTVKHHSTIKQCEVYRILTNVFPTDELIEQY